MASLLLGCASGPPEEPAVADSGIHIVGMVIRNELPYTVTDVMIDVPATGAFAGCGNILPRSQCSTTFQQVEYQGNSLVLSWKEYGAPQHTDEFAVPEPTGAGPGDSFVVEVVVFAPGQAGARLLAADSEQIKHR